MHTLCRAGAGSLPLFSSRTQEFSVNIPPSLLLRESSKINYDETVHAVAEIGIQVEVQKADSAYLAESGVLLLYSGDVAMRDGLEKKSAEAIPPSAGRQALLTVTRRLRPAALLGWLAEPSYASAVRSPVPVMIIAKPLLADQPLRLTISCTMSFRSGVR